MITIQELLFSQGLDPNAKKNSITADQAIEKERLFKNKQGTNSFGLNNN
jgi:hypothetical protein